MKRTTIARAALATILALACVPLARAAATGTVRIEQPDGSAKTYFNVRIVIWNESMAFTSSDGQGTVVLGKAACAKIGELVRCLPYDATLFQGGRTLHIALQTGTVWLNPSQSTQTLSHSTTQLPPRGVLLAVKTKKGTYVTLTGVVDKIQR
ncbi:MAG: hypothetical protein WA814_06470 [Candidatus Baltobacteraceae bacterium]